MRALVQRVRQASVTVDGHVVGEVGPGLLILLGVTHADTPPDAQRLAEKCARLRVFQDGDGRMNRSVLDALDAPAALVISQFTLYADTRRGHRPGFEPAAPGEVAQPLYESFCLALGGHGVRVERGVFGAAMDVASVNDGPVTLMLEWPPDGRTVAPNVEPAPMERRQAMRGRTPTPPPPLPS